MKFLFLACFLIAVFTTKVSSDEPVKPRPPVKLTDEALRIHRSAILVDGHNDLPWQFREKKDFGFQRLDITKVQKELHTDIPRLRQGGMGAQFWSAWVPSESM